MKRKTVSLICGLFSHPPGSLSSYFTAHQTLLCLLDTGAPDQSCIVRFFFSPGRLLKEVQLKTGSFWLVITYICTLWISLSLQPSWPLIRGIITKERSFYVGDSEAALLVSVYLSATALSLSLIFPAGAPWSSKTCVGLSTLHCLMIDEGISVVPQQGGADAYSTHVHTRTLERVLMGSRGVS